MLAASLGRAALLATIPLAALAGALRLEQLLVVAFAVGVLNVFFDVAYGSFLPSVVRREDLPEGNAKLALSAEVARVGGPAAGGALVQALTAPIAVAADAASFLVSAAALARIRTAEPPPAPSAERRAVWSEIGEGVRAVAAHPILRPLVISGGLGNIGDGLLFGSGMYVLYATRELGIEPAALGAILSGLGIGGLVGAAVAGPVTRRLGVGGAFLLGRALWGAAYLSIAFIGGPPHVAAASLAAALAVVGVVNPLVGASGATLQQAVTAERLLGRVVATGRVTMWGAVTVGSLAGGVVAEQAGFRVGAGLSGILPLVGLALLIGSPVRSLREVPKPA
jgi:predicted MFS family arabinose efflux permease